MFVYFGYRKFIWKRGYAPETVIIKSDRKLEYIENTYIGDIRMVNIYDRLVKLLKGVFVFGCYIQRFFLRNKPAWREKHKGTDKTFSFVPFAFKWLLNVIIWAFITKKRCWNGAHIECTRSKRCMELKRPVTHYCINGAILLYLYGISHIW